MANEKVKVKKVSPYPIKASMTLATQQAPGNIVKLTIVGFLIDLDTSLVHVGHKLDINFTLPVLQETVQTRVRVVKIYDRFFPAGGGEPVTLDSTQASQNGQSPETRKEEASKKMNGPVGRVQRMAEMHFLGLSSRDKENLKQFLVKIRQLEGRHK